MSSPAFVPAGMIYCGGGTSVSAGSTCPVIPPLTAAGQAAAAQAVTDSAARGARCKAYQNQQFLLMGGIAALGLVILPGAWKLLGIVAAGAVGWNYPHSPDCDYGF